MEIVTEWFHHLAQGVFWQSFFKKLEWIDIAAIMFAILGVAYGIKKGLLREVAELIELALYNFVVLLYFEKIILLMDNNFPGLSQNVTAPVGFILTAVVTSILFFIVDGYLKKLVHTQLVAPIRVLGGALLGICQWLFLLSFFSQAILLIPFSKLHKVYVKGNSHTGYVMAKLAPKVYQIMGQPFGLK